MSDLEALRRAAVAEESKHARLLTKGKHGKWLSALMLPGLWLLPPSGYGVLTTTGRKTGKLRRKCIRIIREGDRAYLVQLVPPALGVERPGAVASWVWNLRANPRVRVRIRGGFYGGVAREITDVAELAHARQVMCGTVKLLDYGECALHLRGVPSRTKIEELHRYWFDTGHPIVVELS
jgi:deazaflavin-dependent oxidoreductase (nitroreductase family)